MIKDINVAQKFQNGSIYLPEEKKTAELLWNLHPAFNGVFLKHLVKGEDTGDRLSCHLVRIEPGCAIGDHIHEGKMEVHQVISGAGFCIIGGTKVGYQSGVVALIQADLTHRVEAGEDGLVILAQFVPALC